MERQLGKSTLEDDMRRARTWLMDEAGGPTHNILSATHSDTTAATVTRGALIVGESTPKWSLLAHPGAAGYALTTDASDTAWDQTPTWTGDHAWDDGSGDSPAVKFVGGSNDDTISIFLEDNVTAGDSDLVVLLCATDNDSKFEIHDSGDSTVAYIDADGGAAFDGHCAIGDGASINASYALFVDEVYTDTSGTQYAVLGQVESEPAAGFTTTFIGVYGSARQDTAQTQASGRLTGVEGVAEVTSGIAATLVALDGGRFSTDVEDATATTAKGLLAITPAVDTGIAATGIGVHISQGTVGAGSITRLDGLRIDNITAGDTNYAIYTSAGECRFGDDVDIAGVLMLRQEAEPSDPPEDAGVLWCSNGTGTGDPGDLVYKTTEGAVTKTEIVVDFSEI